MGRFQIDNSVVGKALSIGAGDDTIDSRSAWLFENQSGTLGTNLSGSQIYTGAGGNIKAILSGVTGTQGTVLVLDGEDPYGANPSYNGFSNGSGYVTATGLATTCSSSVPKSPAEQPSGLTVDIVVTLPTASITSNGSGYSNGAATVTGGTGSGITLTVAQTGGEVTGITFTDGGSGYTNGDVLTLIQGGSGDNATITLTSAPNGAVTSMSINAAGSNYSVGDIITVVQLGSNGDATRVISAVRDLEPTASDAVIFTNTPAGTILPVSVDYVLATGTAATNMLACK